MSDFKPYPAVDPRDVRDAINVANTAIDAVAGPPGAMLQASRTVLNAMIEAANAAIKQQQGGGSTPTK
jgi:hypothetical protein